MQLDNKLNNVRKYYDLGDFNNGDNVIRMYDKTLAKILRAIIKCGGAITSGCEFEGHYVNPNSNSVVFRIRLLEKNKTKFEEMTGYKLTEPEIVTGQTLEDIDNIDIDD